MTTCPSCGIAGNNFSCPNHISFWGISPLPDSIPMPEQSAWSSLYAEIGRLNVLLNERDKEIERLTGLMPPDERGPGFVGQGSWSVFAEKVVAERDALRDEIVKRDKEIEWLRGERPAVVAWLRLPSEHPDPTRIITMRADEWARRVNAVADFIESGGHRKEEEE